MRTSIASAAFLLVGAGAATLAAVDTTGSNIALNGSDTLFDVTRSVIQSCATQFSDFASQNITYLGGGSGVGAGQMDLNAQQVSPMSRALKSGEFCSGTPAPSTAGLTEDLLLGIDGVALVTNQTTSCTGSTGVANGLGTSAAFAVTDTGVSGGPAPSSCPGCDGSNNYAFADSFDALKVLYFGLHHDGTDNCASPVCKSLVKNWHNRFASDCAAGDATCLFGRIVCPRSAVVISSGTTDAFVSVLNPSGRGIGTPANVPVGASQKTNPFCNSADANASPATVKFGGSGDFTDLDPVRTPCVAGKDGICEAYQNFSSTGVEFSCDFCVVLLVLIPDLHQDDRGSPGTRPRPEAPPARWSRRSSRTRFRPASSARAVRHRSPGSASCRSRVALPRRIRAGVTPNTTKCVDIVPKADGACRQPGRRRRGIANPHCPAQHVAVPDGHRREQAHPEHWRVNRRPTRTRPARTTRRIRQPARPARAKRTTTPRRSSRLTDSYPCSVGFAGRVAAKSYPGLSTGPVTQPLKARAIYGRTAIHAGGGSGPGAERTCWLRLGPPRLNPLSRRAAYFATIYGFGNLLGGAEELAQCFSVQQHHRAAHVRRNGVRRHPGRRAAPRLPRNGRHVVTILPYVQGPGNVALGGCGMLPTPTPARLRRSRQSSKPRRRRHGRHHQLAIFSSLMGIGLFAVRRASPPNVSSV